MKVIELIDFLKECPDDYEVILADWVDGYGVGFLFHSDEIEVANNRKEIVLGASK